MKKPTELPGKIMDFLLTVALGNSEPDNLATDAAELLKASGVKMIKVAQGQYVEKK
jgi:hypothetical protein